MVDYRRKIALLLAFLLALTAFGAAGFHWTEGWSWLDALYATVITLGTVGYGDFVPHTVQGKLFAICLVVLGLSAISYSLFQLTAFVVEGHLQKMLRGRKVDSQLRRVKGHFIVCGAGRTGRHVAEELIKNEVPVVIVDKDPAVLESAALRGIPHLLGDAADDEILKRAGIHSAKGLAASLETDEQNLFLVLTAKGLNPGLRCVAKCIHEASRPKLARAGADAVVAPNMIGGLRMASEMVRPHVVSFLDLMLREGHGSRFEEASVGEGSPQIGKTLASLKLQETLGLVPIALREGGKHFLYNPPPGHHLKAQDTLVVIADPEKLAALKRLLA